MAHVGRAAAEYRSNVGYTYLNKNNVLQQGDRASDHGPWPRWPCTIRTEPYTTTQRSRHRDRYNRETNFDAAACTVFLATPPDTDLRPPRSHFPADDNFPTTTLLRRSQIANRPAVAHRECEYRAVKAE